MRLLERLATESLISAQPNAHISVKHHSYQPSPSLLTTPTSSPIKIGRKWLKVDVAGSNWQKLAEWGFPNVVSLQMHTGSNSDAEISNNFINQLNVLSIMSVNYSLVKYENKMGKNAGESKFYARAQVHESITLKMFSKLISMQTTVSRADVSAVLVSAVENLVMELQRGNQVEFGELGKFRLQLTSEGVEKASDFKGDIHIKGVNIQFVPGDDLSTLFENLEFTQVASRAVQKAALKAEKEGAKTLDIEEAKKTGKKTTGADPGTSTPGSGSTDSGSTEAGGGNVGL